MKWNCGPTRAERWAAKCEWHPWFAWFPVRVSSRDCRWLEVVERRMTGGYSGYYYEKRAKP